MKEKVWTWFFIVEFFIGLYLTCVKAVEWSMKGLFWLLAKNHERKLRKYTSIPIGDDRNE